jgi:hypothetical protein
MRIASRLASFVLVVSAVDARSEERRFELGAQIVTTLHQELDTTDGGFGGRLGLLVTPFFGLEGELSFYPSDIPGDLPVSSSRLEGLFGVKLGPRFDRFSVFGKLRPGFVRFAGAPEPFACILIYPPPLSCILAEGTTVPALDLGGGVELYPTKRSLLRVDVSSLLLRYPGPAFRRDREISPDGGFWGSNLRIAFGGGIRF